MSSVGRGAAIIAALVSAVFFGLNAVGSKILYAPGAPAHFDAVSLFVARGIWSLPLFALLALFTRPRTLPKVSGQDVVIIALCGLLYGPGTNALSALGISRTSASHAVLLLSLFPPLASVLAAVVLRERLAPIRIVAIAVGVLGAATLTLSKPASGSSPVGDAVSAAFIFTWALLTLGIRKLDAKYPPLFVVGVFGTVGAVLLGVMGLLLGRLDAVLIPLAHTDPQTIIWFDLELVLLLSLGGQLLQGFALRTLNVSLVVALTSYGSIFIGLMGSLFILGERLNALIIVAGFILVVALGLALAPESLFKKPLTKAVLSPPSAPQQ
jgi:drug/metabolite transporter (DMT)-like permease